MVQVEKTRVHHRSVQQKTNVGGHSSLTLGFTLSCFTEHMQLLKIFSGVHTNTTVESNDAFESSIWGKHLEGGGPIPQIGSVPIPGQTRSWTNRSFPVFRSHKAKNVQIALLWLAHVTHMLKPRLATLVHSLVKAMLVLERAGLCLDPGRSTAFKTIS
jgi:hypothetical protein